MECNKYKRRGSKGKGKVEGGIKDNDDYQMCPRFPDDDDDIFLGIPDNNDLMFPRIPDDDDQMFPTIPDDPGGLRNIQ